MLRLILSVTILLTSAQTHSSTFYVRVEALSKYNAHHIFANASEFFPPDTPIRESETQRKIECLTSELKASGIYEDVQAEMNPSSREGTRLLEVRVEYHRNIENLTISEISPDGFSEVDMEKFRSILAAKSVEPGMRFLKFNFGRLTEEIAEALRESYPKGSIREDDDIPVWFILRPAGEDKLKLIISPILPKCELAT